MLKIINNLNKKLGILNDLEEMLKILKNHNEKLQILNYLNEMLKILNNINKKPKILSTAISTKCLHTFNNMIKILNDLNEMLKTLKLTAFHLFPQRFQPCLKSVYSPNTAQHSGLLTTIQTQINTFNLRIVSIQLI